MMVTRAGNRSGSRRPDQHIKVIWPTLLPSKSISIHPCVRTLHVPLTLPDVLTGTGTTKPLVASIDAATTAATEGAPAPVPVTRPARQNSLSTETLETLEKRLAHRPDRQELQDRNILKGAPAVLVLCMLRARTHAMAMAMCLTTIVVDRG
jgi:hypothetical protein